MEREIEGSRDGRMDSALVYGHGRRNKEPFGSRFISECKGGLQVFAEDLTQAALNVIWQDSAEI
ncbi:hypothetical protein M5K25_018743 [Dendrobium thyrsiflorum]|uniref:Uncharacterized protein n=1 Tax=Dendrobium thyrsiflorum TaxID=117978 RepID=A0ABD0UD08_DENTH